VGAVFGLPSGANRNYVRVGERRHVVGLAPEALDELLVVGVLAAHHLEGHFPSRYLVAAQEDPGHPPAAQGPDDAIADVDEPFHGEIVSALATLPSVAAPGPIRKGTKASHDTGGRSCVGSDLS
jgi:hypothetical protein